MMSGIQDAYKLGARKPLTTPYKAKPCCPRCRYSAYFDTQDVPISLRRLYIRIQGRLKPIGWICPNCGYIHLTAKFPLVRIKTAKIVE
mgnify:CR=1 FL=1